MPYVASCGIYDAVVAAGVDSAVTYYFDHADGHPVGTTNTGFTTVPYCDAYDPSFSPTSCDVPPFCSALPETSPSDAGSGG